MPGSYQLTVPVGAEYLIVTGADGRLTPSTVDFGTQPVGSITTRPVTITNDGDGPLVLSDIKAGDFQVDDGNCPIGGFGLDHATSCTLQVSFTPHQVRGRRGTGPGTARS